VIRSCASSFELTHRKPSIGEGDPLIEELLGEALGVPRLEEEGRELSVVDSLQICDRTHLERPGSRDVQGLQGLGEDALVGKALHDVRARDGRRMRSRVHGHQARDDVEPLIVTREQHCVVDVRLVERCHERGDIPVNRRTVGEQQHALRSGDHRPARNDHVGDDVVRAKSSYDPERAHAGTQDDRRYAGQSQLRVGFQGSADFDHVQKA